MTIPELVIRYKHQSTTPVYHPPRCRPPLVIRYKHQTTGIKNNKGCWIYEILSLSLYHVCKCSINKGLSRGFEKSFICFVKIILPFQIFFLKNKSKVLVCNQLYLPMLVIRYKHQTTTPKHLYKGRYTKLVIRYKHQTTTPILTERKMSIRLVIRYKHQTTTPSPAK